MVATLALSPKQVAIRTRQLLAQYPKELRLPKYRYHAASGRGVIQYRPLFGKNPKYLAGLYGSDESLIDYAKQIARVVAHKLKTKPAKPMKFDGTLRVSEFITMFISWATVHYGLGRELSHLKRACKPLRVRYATRSVKTIGPVRLKRVREAMIAKGWSRKHVNAQFNRLRSVFAWGVENEHISPRQLTAIRTIRALREGKTAAPEREKVGPVAWQEASKILPHVAPVIATMIEVQYLTGMRSSELTGLRIADIEFREDVWIYRPAKHKTAYAGKSKVICLGPQAQELLIPYLQVPSDQYLFSPRIAMRQHYEARAKASKTKRYGKRLSSRFNPYRYREQYHTDSYSQALQHGFDLMDKNRPEGSPPVHRWHAHQLRHTRATLTREKYSLEGSQSQLGNTLQATEIYALKSLPLAIKVAVETG